MATTTVDQGDLDRLESLLRELLDAGRSEEAATVARDYSLVQESVYSDLLTTPDDDAEFIRDMAKAEAVIAAGRLVPHPDVARRLRSLDDVRYPLGQFY